MNFMTLMNLERFPWYSVAAYWTITALRLKQIKVSEGIGGRLLHIGLMVLAFALLFSHSLDIGPLASRFVPERGAARISGIVLTFMGAGIAIYRLFSRKQTFQCEATPLPRSRIRRRVKVSEHEISGARRRTLERSN